MKTSISIFLAALMSQAFGLAMAQNGNQRDSTETPIPVHIAYDMNEETAMASSKGQLVSKRFVILNTIEIDYIFMDFEEKNSWIHPAFIDESTRLQFEASLRAEELKTVEGMIIYCDCVGERKEINGFDSFVVHQAHIVVQLPKSSDWPRDE